MVIDGFARAMTDWHLDYAAAEWRARRGKHGLWADGGGIGDPAAHRRAEAARLTAAEGAASGEAGDFGFDGADDGAEEVGVVAFAHDADQGLGAGLADDQAAVAAIRASPAVMAARTLASSSGVAPLR